MTYCVVPAGAEWLERFDACIAAASSVTYASGMNYVGDDQQFAYGSRVAMGMARLRASQIMFGFGADCDLGRRSAGGRRWHCGGRAALESNRWQHDHSPGR